MWQDGPLSLAAAAAIPAFWGRGGKPSQLMITKKQFITCAFMIVATKGKRCPFR